MNNTAPHTATPEQYRLAVAALWLAVRTIATLPLREIRSVQLEAIAKAKLDDPAGFAAHGWLLEQDAEASRAMISAIDDLRAAVPELKTIVPRWPAPQPPASRPR